MYEYLFMLLLVAAILQFCLTSNNIPPGSLSCFDPIATQPILKDSAR